MPPPPAHHTHCTNSPRDHCSMGCGLLSRHSAQLLYASKPEKERVSYDQRPERSNSPPRRERIPAISRTSASLKPCLLAPAGIWKAATFPFILLPQATMDPATHSVTLHLTPGSQPRCHSSERHPKFHWFRIPAWVKQGAHGPAWLRFGTQHSWETLAEVWIPDEAGKPSSGHERYGNSKKTITVFSRPDCSLSICLDFFGTKSLLDLHSPLVTPCSALSHNAAISTS